MNKQALAMIVADTRRVIQATREHRPTATSVTVSIGDLEYLLAAVPVDHAEPEGKSTGSQRSPESIKRQSERMKAWWAARKQADAKKTSKSAPATPSSPNGKTKKKA